MAVNCIFTFTLSTFIIDEAELLAITNIGVVLLLFVCMASLMRLPFLKKDLAYFVIFLLEVTSCAAVFFYSSKLIHEFNNIIPFAFPIVLGVAMYSISKIKGIEALMH